MSSSVRVLTLFSILWRSFFGWPLLPFDVAVIEVIFCHFLALPSEETASALVSRFARFPAVLLTKISRLSDFGNNKAALVARQGRSSFSEAFANRPPWAQPDNAQCPRRIRISASVERPEVDPGDQHGFTPAKADVHCGHGFRREAVCGSTLPIDLPVPRARSFAFIPDGLKVVKRNARRLCYAPSQVR
jgi:hypothetical protein